MKTIYFYKKFVKDIDTSKMGSENIIQKRSVFGSLGFLALRKLTSQRFRLLPLNLSEFKKIHYFAKHFSIDYLEYIFLKNPDMPYGFYPSQDAPELDYFIKVILMNAIKPGFDEKDFEGRWKKFEVVRKRVGRDIKYNLLTNKYEIYGFKSVVYPDTGVFPDNQRLDIFKRKSSRVCIDAGAYIGDSAFVINNLFKPDIIYSFEPDRKNLEVLRKNLLLNGIEKKVVAVNAGVGRTNGYVSVVNGGAASKLSTEVGKPGKDKIQIVSIDSFIKKNNISKVDLIKMDIEGEELNALIGATKTIKDNHPDLVIALYHRGEHFFEIPKFLKSLVPDYNFRFMPFSGSSPVIERFILASVRRI